MMRASDSRLLIRADGGPTIGMGHLMRCLALAHAWSDLGGKVNFVAAGPLDGFQDRITRDGFSSSILNVEAGSSDDIDATIKAASSFGAQHVVMDGYSFGPDFQRGVSQRGFATVCIDDYGHLASYNVDLIVNQNLDATPALYPGAAAGTRLLLGSDFVMLRRDFISDPRRPKLLREPGTRVLVTMGGADPQNVTLRVAERVIDLSTDVDVAIVVGAANPRRAAVAAIAESSGGRLRMFIDVPSLRELMDWADVIVCAGGTTCWEAAFLGLPMIVVVLAENQVRIADAIARHGAAINLGSSALLTGADVTEAVGALLLDCGGRAEMTQRAVRIVDGLGSKRVAVAIQSLRSAA